MLNSGSQRWSISARWKVAVGHEQKFKLTHRRMISGVENCQVLLTVVKISSGLLMITSKLASKAETTIPRAVRAALHLMEGEEIAYEIEEKRDVLSKASPRPVGNPFVTFDEWLG